MYPKLYQVYHYKSDIIQNLHLLRFDTEKSLIFIIINRQNRNRNRILLIKIN